MRPIRVYLHTFRSGASSLGIVRAGGTPCKAKASAFTELERLLREDPSLPQSGWSLSRQEDVTHRVQLP